MSYLWLDMQLKTRCRLNSHALTSLLKIKKAGGKNHNKPKCKPQSFDWKWLTTSDADDKECIRAMEVPSKSEKAVWGINVVGSTGDFHINDTYSIFSILL